MRSVFMEMEYSKSIKDTVNIFVVFKKIFSSHKPSKYFNCEERGGDS